MKSGTRIIGIAMLLITFPSLAIAAKTHIVKKNDSLYSLSKRYHVSVQAFKSANNLVSSHLKLGEKLVVPPRSSSTAQSHSKIKVSVYKVRKGDTLTRIARKTGLSVAELKRINGISAKSLKPGKMLSLRESEPVQEVAKKPVRSYTVRNTELFSTEEYERTLAELTDSDPEKTVDLGKDLELTTDASKRLKKTAFSFLGTRYRFGGSSRSGLDCSSFVQHVFRDLDIQLPRTAREQFHTGEPVNTYQLQKGDLVFFRTYASFPSHVGIYLGDNKMIHASSRDHKVVISSINTPYFRSRYIGAKRHPTLNPDTVSLEDLFAGSEVAEEKDEEVLLNDTLGVQMSN
ncbi:MAG: peptidoglycan endopeptidase [Deltaproteobacteria bacterium]|nr:peptidoglycan endopeptidase [Deltaproteobacteria bacterium]TLN03550.1 MAG: LysM peptidoglycan-binding domain-containing protein [bacterium]